MTPLFSILIPAIKTRFLRQAIESVLAQTVGDFELVVVDDCGPDSVLDVISCFGDERIVCHRTPQNMGQQDPTCTWNWALPRLRGQFVVLLGDDDCLASNYLEQMGKRIGEAPSGVVFRSRVQVLNAVGDVMQTGPVLPREESWDAYLFRRNRQWSPQSTSEWCLRREALVAIGGYVAQPLALASDDLTYLKMASLAPILSTNGTWAGWRNHPGALSSSMDRRVAQLGAVLSAMRFQTGFVWSHRPERHGRLALTGAVVWRSVLHLVEILMRTGAKYG